MLASSGGVRSDSAILTRTSGVTAISEMLAVGACCANAAADCINTAAKAANFNDLPSLTKLSPKAVGYRRTVEEHVNANVSRRSSPAAVGLPSARRARNVAEVHVSRLALTDFRSYADALVEPGPSFVLLYGENGAGKTNLLEAVSLLSPGRGIRGAALSDMARNGGSGGFAVAARLDQIDIGTGTSGSAPDRRQVRINAAPASANSLGEWLSVLWLTPAMDRLFTATAGDRRRFLDRLVLALEPGHAHHAARYEAAMRSRNKLLAEPERADPSWLEALEAQMAEHGVQIAEARARTVSALDERFEQAPEDEFARARIGLEGWSGGDLAGQLRESRSRDTAAGLGLIKK
jgi:recombinational DNA repair ATPase RecF